MQAMIVQKFGGPDVIEPAQIDRPGLAEDEVLVRVRAAGVNPIDCKMRSGDIGGDAADLPLVLGRDVAGVVEQVGTAVRSVYPGEEVYAFLATHGGGYAEFAVARDSEVAAKPATLDDVHAAAVPLAATTAWQALFDQGRLESGQRVLIHGAAGGVGHFAVQFARTRDAEVIATARTEDAAILRDLGCADVIDHGEERFEERVAKVDLVVDLIGGETRERSWGILKRGGTLVSTLGPPDAARADELGVQARFFMAAPTRRQLQQFATLIDAGRVRVIVQRRLPLTEARRAHEELERAHTLGKTVLTVA